MIIKKRGFRWFKTVKLNWKKRNPASKSLIWKVILICLVFFVIIPILIVWFWFYKNIYTKIPPISNIENINFAQTTTIVDRNWKVLYKLFDENRYYVSLDKISQNMINAIIATEDKNFWQNPWIDFIWLARAWVYDLMNPWSNKHWWSTLTQQLIRNLLLTRDKTIERKLKEMVLSLQLNDHIRNQMKQKYWWLNDDQLDKKMKEKILELYLNYVPFSNNAYWVEAAAQTYFGTSANNLDILQSAILSAIPNAPSRYNPYTNYQALMWEIKIKNAEEFTWLVYTWELKKLIKKTISEKIDESSFTFSKDTNAFLKYLGWLLDFELTYKGNVYKIQYIPWRKDLVLWRMYEMGYIDQKVLKDCLNKWLHVQFKTFSVNLDAPHFVFWVIEELKKNYGEELLMKWWLTIKTSLDMDIQNIAKESMKANLDYQKKKWANNASMIYLDSQNGDILAYVWSLDYNDENIDWKVDIIQAPRQPWSTIKPLLYSLWFMKNNFVIDTPIYDLPYKVWASNPENVDWQYNWLMSLKTALAGSRNIPAIKMYFIIWEDKEFKTFLRKVGITSLSMSTYYWYPLAIWAWELKIFELATAYSHLSAMGQPAKINPVLEIRWPDNSLIYKKKIEHTEQVIPTWVAYLLRNILSTKENMPAGWIATFDYKWLKVATKSWTTNVKLKNWQKLPRDWWLVNYTPSKVAVYWAGNTKWEPLNRDAYWGWLNSITSKEFLKRLKEKWYIQSEDVEAKEVKKVTISKLSWKLATNDTPLWLAIGSLWYIKSLPSEYDDGVKKVSVDKLCNWKANELTSPDDLIEWYIIKPTTIMPLKQDLETIKNRWRDKWSARISEMIKKPILSEEPKTECEERKNIGWEWELQLEVLSPENAQQVIRDFSLWYRIKSNYNITKVFVYLDDLELWNYNYSKNNVVDIKNISLPSTILPWEHNIKVITRDEKWNEQIKSIAIQLMAKDDKPPYLIIDRIKSTKLENWNTKIDLIYKDNESQVAWWQIFQNKKLLQSFEWNIVTLEVSDISWLTFEVKDKSWNTWYWDIVVE